MRISALGSFVALACAVLISAGSPPPDRPEPSRRKPPPVACPPGKTCVDADCHGNYLAREYVHGPVARNKCEACHTYTGEEHKFELTEARETLCTSCHQVRWGAYLHEPFAKGECDRCHDPHASDHRLLLRGNPAKDLCFSCHEHEPGKILPGAHQHGPAEIGACIVCHESHASWNPKLLVAQGDELCLSCHDDTVKRDTGRRHIHEPFEKAECMKCHDAHSSPSRTLVKAETETLCYSCHDAAREQAHASVYRHGALNTSEECLSCHRGHASEVPKLLAHGEFELCLECHDEEVPSYSGRKLTNMAELFRNNPQMHGPVARGDCSSCHEPHVASHPRLLVEPYPPEFYAPFSEERYRLCFLCHLRELVLQDTTELTRFRQGRRNLHFLHVHKAQKGRTCRVCHEVHTSRQPFHMREWVPFGRRQWKLEIGFEPLPDGGRCAPGCHKEQEYHWTGQKSGGGAP